MEKQVWFKYSIKLLIALMLWVGSHPAAAAPLTTSPLAGSTESLTCVVLTDFNNYTRSKPISVTVELTNRGAEVFAGELTLSLESANGHKKKMSNLSRKVTLPLAWTETIDQTLKIDAVTSGDYVLVAQLVRDTRVLAESRRPIFIAPALKPFMGFGLYSVPGSEDGLRTAAGLGFNVIQNQYWGEGPGKSYLADYALRYGLVWQATVEPIYNRNELAAKYPEMALTGPDGKVIPNSPSACFTHPEVVKQTEAELERWLRDIVKFPAFCNRLLADDDVHLPEQACYNASCQSLFKQKTGLDTPTPEAIKQVKPGIVPDNNPWLQWYLFRCSDIRGNLPRIYMKVKNEVCPEAIMGAVKGLMQNPFYTPAMGEYPPLFDSQYDVPSSYAYLYWVRPTQDYIVHGAWAHMGNRGKDIWMLGDFLRWIPWILEKQPDGTMALNLMKSLQKSGEDDLVPYPAGAFRKEMWCLLAGGFKDISMFELAPSGSRRDIRGTELEREIKIWGQRCKQFGLMLKELQEPTRPVAVLTSITASAFGNGGGEAGVFKDCLHEHVPVDMIAEEEILTGGLKDRKVLLLPTLNFVRQSVADAIVQFAKEGGIVIADDEAAVRPEGSVVVKRSEMAKQAATRINRALDCDNPNVVIREFERDGVKYYYLVNVYTDRWGWGGEDNDNRVYAEPYTPRPVKATLRLAKGSGVVWDIFNNRELQPEGNGDFRVELGGDDGMLLALYPAKTVKATVTCESSIAGGDAVHLAVKLLGTDGKPAKGVVPVEIRVLDPNGVASEYSRYYRVVGGMLNDEFQTARNDTPGVWKVQVQSLVGTAAAQASFTLKPPQTEVEAWSETARTKFESGALRTADNTPGVVLLMHFDEGSGVATSDSSTSQNNGAINGTIWTNGKFGKALNFNGIADSVVLSKPISDQTITVEAWIKLKNYTNPGEYAGSTIIGHSYPGYATGTGWSLYVNSRSKKLEFTYFDSDATRRDTASNTPIVLNTWYHVAATRDAATGVVSLYINGNLDATQTHSTANILSSGPPSIGTSAGANNFDGTIDEVCVSNVVRSSFR